MPPKVRRREPRKRGLYYHSTPPKVIPANETRQVERRYRNKTSNNDVFVVKPSNIRIWIHDKDIAKLTRVLWSGQGFRLLNETSTHAKVRKFLENVPLVLNTVKEIHAAVIENNTEQLQFLLELPPPAIITTKDQNGLTVVHKAAGLGHPEMLDFIVKTWPQGSKEIDKTGKTPLHWSALAKDAQNSIQEMLMQNFGVQEEVMDYKMKTPAYYKTKPQELEKSFLTSLPTAPRIQRHQVVDWGLLEDDIGDLNGSRPMDKIVVEKKKATVERDEEGIDPDLEESAKKSKNNLDENKNQSNLIENMAPISKILQNGKIPNGTIISNDNNNNTEYITTPINHDQNTINSIQNGDIVNGNLIMNGDDREHESISLEPSPSPLSLPDTPDQTFENTPSTIKQIDTPDIQEIKTPQMVQSDESLKDNLETNSTNNEQDEENLTTPNSNELQNLIEDSDEKLNDEKLDNNDDDDQNIIETDDKLENFDIINSDNNSDIVNNINDNLNNESTNEEEELIKENDDNNEPDNEANNKELDNEVNEDGNETIEPDNETNEPDNETNEPDNETNEPDNETNGSENKTEEQENEKTSENIENDEIQDNDETKELEDNNELNNANNQENNESNETKVEENEEQEEKPTEDTETIENNDEEAKTNDEPETNEIDNNEETKLDDDNVEKMIENESNQDENNNVEKVEHESENVETETENDNKPVETNNDENDEKQLENLKTETESIKTATSTENKQDENNNNNENELNSNNKPDDIRDEGSDDETSLNDSMDQTDYDVGSTDGTHQSSFRSPSSPSMSHDIEGFVHGEPDDNQVQSQSTEVDLDEETKINEIIKSGDMEQLAAIVLNGQGNKLLGAQSSQPEIQAFLDNVPSYMSKINRVHQAARDGNLRELQAALDRRKFAIARNDMSPKGATPLHVSTMFGHSGIVRYLAGRFPETTTTVDEDGRTPLHYAATINDNGHFYNLLVHFGSNPKATDKLGNTPEYYKDHKSTAHILSHKQLLKSFGANETLETEMFSDQELDSNNNMNTIGKNNKKTSQQVDIPLFKTEQGQYLAANLGDPLVKALTEIADKRPDDPIEFLINYLQDYVQIRNQNGGKKPINGLTNHINGVVTQPGSGSQSSAIPAKPNPPSVGGNSVQLSRQESENKLDAGENEGTDDDNLSDSAVVTEDRDEHGQSMLHFACARSHGRNALISLIDESNIDITYRDELYRTARDVSMQANQPGNAKEIDRYVLSLAANGDDKPFQHMLLNGYDHILDVEDEDGNNIFDICRTRASSEISRFLDKVRSFEETREQIHAAVRLGQLDTVEELTIVAIGSQLIKAKNYYGRTALHIAVLKESEDIVEYIATNFPEAIKIGDNLERTPLHYAMGVSRVENVSRILINKGAKRTAKDLKGRQPSYYFINKSDILRLQEEETEDR